jgi:hypothetical protein
MSPSTVLIHVNTPVVARRQLYIQKSTGIQHILSIGVNSSYRDSNSGLLSIVYVKIYFKVNSDNHYTIRANALLHEVGFEPTQHMLPGLKSGSLDQSDIRAFIYTYTPPHTPHTPPTHYISCFSLYHFYMKISYFLFTIIFY